MQHGEKRLAQAAKLAGLGYCTFNSTMESVIDCDQNYADFHGKSIQEMKTLNVGDDILKQEQLAQSQKNEAIGKLTGGVAHDFNNILAVIQGNVEIIQAKSESTSLQQHAETALKAVTQGGKLTQQLLSFARKQPLSPVVIDVPQLIRNSAVLLQTSVGEIVDLKIVSDNDVWNTRADPVQLEAVILNLLVNARDAMSHGGSLLLKISNATLNQEYADANVEVEAGNYICISVKDSGTGMSPEVVKQAIEPFFTSKPVGKGTGLGLSMAFGFARQSGGHLKIESRIGQGTTVNLYLPRVLTEAPVSTPEIVPEHDVTLKGLRVFLIEDNEDLRQIFSSQMSSLGCIVHSANDEVSALALATRVKQVDVILSDIIIPGAMDGRALSKRLQVTYPEARVVYISGFTEDSILHNGRLDDGVVLLQKPFRLIELARVLTDHA